MLISTIIIIYTILCPDEGKKLELKVYVCSQYAEVLPVLSSLVRTKQYSQAGVWLKQGECQQMLGELEDAIVSYSKVLAPNYTDTRCVGMMMGS